VEVGQDLLDHPLGPAVGVGRGLLGALLRERAGCRVAVDRGGAGEDDVLAAVVAHHVHEREGVAQVVGVVLDGLADGLAHGLEASEVDHAVDVVLVKDGVHGLAVVDVGAVEGEVGGSGVAHDGLDAADDLLRRVGEVVDNDYLVAVLKELHHRVAANEAGAAGDEHAGVLWVFCFAHGFPFGSCDKVPRGE
jgi:hypothetical protein